MNRYWKKFFLIYLLVGSLSGCSKVKVYKLRQLNPTSYIFNASVENVKIVILEKFGKHPRYKNMFLCTKDDCDWPDAVKILSSPGNENDAYLGSFGDPIGKSKVYHRGGKELEYSASFHLHISIIGQNQTRVSVNTYEPKIVYGLTTFKKAHGERAEILMDVDPTSVEEYEILLRIGSALGEQGMPELILPEPK